MNEITTAAGQLARHEQFSDYMGAPVTTVAGCRQALRDEAQLCRQRGGNLHNCELSAAEAARHAVQALIAREAARPGTGATRGRGRADRRRLRRPVHRRAARYSPAQPVPQPDAYFTPGRAPGARDRGWLPERRGDWESWLRARPGRWGAKDNDGAAAAAPKHRGG